MRMIASKSQPPNAANPFGFSPLKRELTLIGATALVISNMIGTGIFTTSGFLARDLGKPLWVLAVWVCGAIVAIAGCLVYAELAVNLPRSGGEYVYLREAWGPGWGFLSGWVSFFAGFSAPVAAAALAFSAYVAPLFPSLGAGPVRGASSSLLHLGRGDLLAVSLIVAFGALNIAGLKLAAQLQNALTVVKVSTLAGFVIVGLAWGKGNWAHFAASTPRLTSHPLPLEFAVSLTFVMFAYSGWNAATYMTEEIRQPERNLPRALVGGTVIVALIYLASNVLFIYALPLGSMRGVLAIGSVAAAALFGGRGGDVFSVIVATALLSCISAMMMAGPRVYYAMALDGYFPAAARKVHRRRATPVVAILAQTLAAGIMVVTGTFEALLYYIGFMLVLFSGLAAAGIIKLRRRPGWSRLRPLSAAWPLVPSLFVIATAGMLISTIRLRPHESLLGCITVASGAALYIWKFRR